MEAMTLSFPPHSEQTSMSIPKTLLSLLTQLMEERLFGFALFFSFSELLAFGVMRWRGLKFGANTPWNLVRFTLDLGIKEASWREKIQGFKDDVSGSITIRCFEVVGVESAREKSLFLISLNESPFFQKPDNSLNKAS